MFGFFRRKPSQYAVAIRDLQEKLEKTEAELRKLHWSHRHLREMCRFRIFGKGTDGKAYLHDAWSVPLTDAELDSLVRIDQNSEITNARYLREASERNTRKETP